MVRSRSTLHVAVEIDGAGAHPAAWRVWGRPPVEVVSAQALRDSVAVAEAAGFALVTFDDRVVPGSARTPVGRLDSRHQSGVRRDNDDARSALRPPCRH